MKSKGARFAWVALCALLAAAALALAAACGFSRSAPGLGANVCLHALDWQPGHLLQEPWRAWSAALVHLSALHLGANLAGCAVLALFGWAVRVPARMVWAWVLAWPLTHIALGWLQPELLRYGGLSGLLHAGVVLGAWPLLRRASLTERLIGWAVLLGLAVKIINEKPWGAALQQLPHWDFAVAPMAHATGAAAGLLMALLWDGPWRKPAADRAVPSSEQIARV